jgi:general stress protein 26
MENLTTRSPVSEATGRFREILSKFDNAILVTRRPGGECHGRPMAIARIELDSTMWFVTSIDAPKLVEIGSDPHVLVCLQGGSRFATVNGMVSVVRDPAKIEDMWRESFRVWFDGKDDPKLVLLRLTPITGEYWDQSGIRGLKYAFRAAKAILTDERLRLEEPEMHANVKL